MSRILILLMRALGKLPLPALRALGTILGLVLYGLLARRRRIAQTNLTLCFPEKTLAEWRVLTRAVFVHFAQAWLDRGWLWHAKPALLTQRLKLSGDVDALYVPGPIIIFAPHFMGLDAAWTALAGKGVRLVTVYTDQANPTMDAWILGGRSRVGDVQLLGRRAGVRPILGALAEGRALYLLPDMNFGPKESIFVPFYGVAAATIPSLSRFARLSGARVVPVISHMTKAGYEIEVLSSWQNFPTEDLYADTAFMNRQLETYIDQQIDQYYWVHQRFKTRPSGEAGVY